jgi:phosphatidyl-myo-inositol alpha-mannosyltransferase
MICPYSLAVWGGVQSQVLGLARALRAQGIDTQVLAPCDGPPPEPWVTPLGNSMPYAQNGSFAPVAPDPPAQLRVLGAIWDQRFDLLHLHEPLAPGPTLTATVVKPVPLVGTFHASGTIAVYRWGRPVLRRIASRLDVKVAVSAEAAAMASHHLGGTYEVLFNGIEVDRYASAAPVATPGPTVLFLGRHEPRKGLSVLLEAARLLPPDVTLWIAGNGPETEALKGRHRHDERIVWLGPLSEAEKLRRLRSADVFCAPSINGESFGVVLLEAMAAGTPVVASDLPGYRQVARGGHDGVLVAPGDSEALAKALLGSLGGGVEVEQRVQRGRERADQFAMSRLAEAYLSRYQRLVG